MEAEEAVEIDGGVAGSRRGPGDGDGPARLVVGAVTMRHDHAQAVDGTALKHHDQHLAAKTSPLCQRSAHHEGRYRTERQQRQCAVLHERSTSVARHAYLL